MLTAMESVPRVTLVSSPPSMLNRSVWSGHGCPSAAQEHSRPTTTTLRTRTVTASGIFPRRPRPDDIALVRNGQALVPAGHVGLALLVGLAGHDDPGPGILGSEREAGRSPFRVALRQHQSLDRQPRDPTDDMVLAVLEFGLSLDCRIHPAIGRPPPRASRRAGGREREPPAAAVMGPGRARAARVR